jgi:hypothetical protein
LRHVAVVVFPGGDYNVQARIRDRHSAFCPGHKRRPLSCTVLCAYRLYDKATVPARALPPHHARAVYARHGLPAPHARRARALKIRASPVAHLHSES